MKKIYILLNILLGLGFVTNSCIYDKVAEDTEHQDDPDPDPDPDPNEKERTFKFLASAVFSQKVETYAYVSMQSNVPVIVWSNTYETPDLNVGLYLKGGSGANLLQNHELKINSWGNSECSSTVTLNTSEENGTLYGYYPYQASVAGTMLSYDLKTVQDQSVKDSLMDSRLNRNMLMISDPSSSFALNGGDGRISLKNVFSILRFRVNMSQEVQILQPIKRITVYIANKDKLETPLNYVLAGNYTIDLSKPPMTPGYVGPVFSSFENVITATLSDSENLTMNSPKPSVWIVANPQVINPTDRLVAIVELDGYKIISTYEMAELEPNTVYDFHVVSKKANTVSDYVNTYFSGEMASNCYIIPQAGLCQIPLKVKSGADIRGHSVDWLWASKEGGDPSFDISELIDPSTIVYNGADGYVRFRVGTDFGKYTKGNVVLALKDASGNIVWTWHIWITDKPEDIQYDGNKFLDRNIGALSADTLSPAIDTYGFVYQWGRKDPFVGGDGVIYDESDMPLYVARTHTIVNTSATWGAGVSEWSQVGMAANTSVEESRKYPMRFFYNGESSSEADPADWLHESETDLWSDEGKTDYDPCPYGYKVPDKGDLNALHMAFDNYEIYLEDLKVNPSKPIPSIWFYNRKNSNRYWEYSYSNTVTSWPLTGMRQGRNTSGKWIGAQLKYAGTDNRMGRAFYWTSTPLTVDGRVVPGSSHRIATNSFILYSPDEYGANADAYPVRCVKMTNP